jgi:hypothetical protein
MRDEAKEKQWLRLSAGVQHYQRAASAALDRNRIEDICLGFVALRPLLPQLEQTNSPSILIAHVPRSFSGQRKSAQSELPRPGSNELRSMVKAGVLCRVERWFRRRKLDPIWAWDRQF